MASCDAKFPPHLADEKSCVLKADAAMELVIPLKATNSCLSTWQCSSSVTAWSPAATTAAMLACLMACAFYFSTMAAIVVADMPCRGLGAIKGL